MTEEVELIDVVTIPAQPASPLITVAQIREKIASLEPRPDPQQVEDARISLAAVEHNLAEALEKIFFAKQPPDVQFAEWKASQDEAERLAREYAEREKLRLRGVLQLEELHELYRKSLREAEFVLVHGQPQVEKVGRLSQEDEKGLTMAGKLINEALEKKSQELDLSNKSLPHVPEVIGKISSLLVLDLSNNHIEVLPDAISGLVNLEKLNVHRNRLEHLPDSIGLMKKLKVLDASRNKLKALPSSISGCCDLVELNLEFNSIEYLPTNFGIGLSSLEKLSLAINNMARLPESLCEAKSLKHLDLHYNKIKFLPWAFGKLENLETLDASRNFMDLTWLPESMGDLSRLTFLDLSYNQIKELPLSFGRLENIRTFKMDENPLVDPPMDILPKGTEAIMKYLAERWQNSLNDAAAAAAAAASQEQSGVVGWLSGLYTNITGYLTSDRNKDDMLEQQL